MYTHQEDIIYGRKYGTALTMDVFTPQENPRGVGLILVVSGGWVASHEAVPWLLPGFISPLVNRGYTVFAVVPSSQPKYTIPEIIADMNRAVRFIRHEAQRFNIDHQRLGIYGGSAGGHLALMVGLAGDLGDATAEDPIERVSSRVQAIAEFYAPTDFLNYGQNGAHALGDGLLADYHAPFDFHDFDAETKTFQRITDERRILEIARQISPITHVDSDSPPTLAIHGEVDLLVPLQQSQILVEKLKQAKVATRLVVKAGAEHGWEDVSAEIDLIGDWFDTHLNGREKGKG